MYNLLFPEVTIEGKKTGELVKVELVKKENIEKLSQIIEIDYVILSKETSQDAIKKLEESIEVNSVLVFQEV